ncbi:hypothetical protein FGM00_02195 [Aggregatimonas sangjinii]|uniref:Beta-lactamase-related domain-containing protein n=1 Tax=Aggregatimonas sangjinii TaxID=2583587 RepID=A0A5B7SQR2_9FLAO|nr:serine hydrolase [Aggregatimonas sangjinii]QCW98983.1 hypothetical protein FGM00_02195 [Aggregatimonas sangjinii]
MKNRIWIFFLALVATACKENEKTVVDNSVDPMVYSMNNNAEIILENPEINSISIGVYKDGQTYENYYGEIDDGKSNKPNENSLFEIASVTKTFTAFLMAQAVLDGKLSLGDDIRMYLEGSYPNLEYEGRPIQIKDLLTHTSGITRALSETLGKLFSPDASDAERKAMDEYDTASLLADVAKFELDTIPGTRFDYSPMVGPEILAIILEKVYQKPYAELLKEHILVKADMNDTFLQVEGANAKNMVNGYTDDGEFAPPVNIPLTGAGGGLKSTVPDLLKYIRFLLESKDPVISEMQKPLFFDEEDGDQYGYFWNLGEGEFMHSGGTRGTTNWLILSPQYNSGFTVIFNSNGKNSGRLINRIANRILDDIENYPKQNAYFVVRKAVLKDTEKGIEYYHQLKKDSLAHFDFDDDAMLNLVGYDLLRQDRTSEAIKIFQLLVSEFPDSANPYDSLGEAYFMNEAYDLALANYQKSYELNPENENALMMMERIEEAKKNQ